MPEPMVSPVDAWRIDAANFPRDGSAEDRLRFAVGYAILAPSGHNSQPWQFRVRGATLELRADWRRALPRVDPAHRELVLGCGAALHTLSVALHALGQGHRIELTPEPEERALLARVHLDGSPPKADARAFAAIDARHTTRGEFVASARDAEHAAALVAAAARDDVELVVATPAARARWAEHIAEGDRQQGRDPSFRRELAAWVHANHSGRRDGMPGYAHGFGGVLSRLAPWVIGHLDWGKSQARRDRQLALTAPILAVLTTRDDDMTAWLRCGQALSQLLLEATARGLVAAFLNQPCEVPALRGQLQATLQGRYPQLLLRLGTAPASAPTPRRPLQDVLG